MPRKEPLSPRRSIRRYEIPCTPPVWASSGHAQTLWSHLLPSPGPRLIRDPGNSQRALEVEVEDGERLLVIVLPGSSGIRVHLFHGLSGDVNSEYMRRTAAALAARGHEVWAVNHRGCGEGHDLAVRPYHSGKTEDLAAVLGASRSHGNARLHLVIGFSLSGNLALLHAARHADPRPDGIVAVNPPVDLEGSTERIGQGLSRLYELRFIWRLRREVHRRQRLRPLQRRYEIPAGASLREFDDLFTAPECGFEDALDYYRKCSAAPRLDSVKTPAIILTAADDPFVDATVYERCPRSEEVFLHVEPTGGHVGYLARRGALGWNRWLDGALVHYVEELVSMMQEHDRKATRA